jgi:hypothetical protein
MLPGSHEDALAFEEKLQEFSLFKAWRGTWSVSATKQQYGSQPRALECARKALRIWQAEKTSILLTRRAELSLESSAEVITAKSFEFPAPLKVPVR